MRYEELYKITSGRIEAVDEAMQMTKSRKAVRLYEEFGNTGSLETFEQVVAELYKETGYRF